MASYRDLGGVAMSGKNAIAGYRVSAYGRIAGDGLSTGTYVISSNYRAAGKNRTTGVGVSALEGKTTLDDLSAAGALGKTTK